MSVKAKTMEMLMKSSKEDERNQINKIIDDFDRKIRAYLCMNYICKRKDCDHKCKHYITMDKLKKELKSKVNNL